MQSRFSVGGFNPPPVLNLVSGKTYSSTSYYIDLYYILKLAAWVERENIFKRGLKENSANLIYIVLPIVKGTGRINTVKDLIWRLNW